jgi:Skp family chaperone for outer membrane proteins
MTTILTVDLAAVLDKSRVGAEASKSLEKAWNEAKAQPDEKRRVLLDQLQAKRDGLRARLLERARPAIAALGKEKKATAVLEAGGVLWTSAEDITAAVIAKVDAGGPL